MDLAVAIVSYNTRQLTSDCLASLYRALELANLNAHVWVVDNASSDASAEMVQARFPQATLIASQENLGFSRGANLAIERMSALNAPPRHLLLLNPDTLVEEAAIRPMVSFLDAHPQVGAVGAQLSYPDGSFQHGAFRFPTLWMALFDFWPINHRLLDSPLNGRYPRRLYQAGEPFPIDHPLGAALMIRWETLHQVGPLDPGYFMYCEEIDWCMRAKALGWKVCCVPQARIVHLGGQSTQQFRDEMFVALWKSRYRLFEKHYSRLYRALVRIIVRAGLASSMARTRRALKRGDLGQEDARQRLAAYRLVRER